VSAAALVLLGIKISIVITVLGIGLSTTRSDATSVFRDPAQLVRSLLAMQVIVPLFAILVVRTFDLEIPVKIALVALAVSPVPPIWPKRTLQAGGELAYTIGLLVASSVLSILIIPSAVALIESIFSVPMRISPASIASIVFVTVIIPLFVGIEIRRVWPRFANRASEMVTKAGFALLVLCALPLLVKSLPAIGSLIGNGTLLTMIALVLVGLGAGHLLGGPVEGERTVLGLACATRHPAIALTIATANFPNEKFVPAAIVLYLLVSFIVSTPYVLWNKRHADRSHRPILAALR
jgi:BASS family bile acid:Na+ symporter